jgi:hypothetical protein
VPAYHEPMGAVDRVELCSAVNLGPLFLDLILVDVKTVIVPILSFRLNKIVNFDKILFFTLVT